MNIYFYQLLFVFALLLTACGGSDRAFTLKGHIEGQNELNILAYSPNGGFEGYDTIKVKKGTFKYERELVDSAIVALVFPKNIQTLLVALPGDVLEYEAQASALSRASVEGSEENELLTKFRKNIADKQGKELQAEVTRFVEKHPKSLAAVAVYEQYVLSHANSREKKMYELIFTLQKHQPENAYVSLIAEHFSAKARLEKGQKTPYLQLETLKGDTIHLGDSIKRPTAILFWSTWLDASLQQASLIQRLKKELNGKVDFVAVSLDYNADEFKYRLGADTLAMDLVCDGLVWQSPAVLAYDVQTIPGNILLDKEGKVYARDVIHVELEKTIREMIE